MMVSTLQFGQIVVEEDHIITFPQGLPGFEEYRQYVILQSEADEPFSFMQSVDNHNLSFVITNPFLFYPSYEFQLPESVEEELGIKDAKDLMIWSIITVSSDIENITINLLAPVIINMATKIGKQVILHNTPYKTKHRLVDSAANTVPSQMDGEPSC
ncbi:MULTISPECIES: flagellar assembly protein FliW [Paenibacillus]|uniref:Flagellar assembly factor FliW n=1 Tax=Paenibacillus naphthalenovorans TaxID=162209 RepID=A0A0U2M869_9BACL|nr:MULTISPECIES: flagellar assembly protein FliW [Paenibacillus]ALS24480.1 flagellar assembly factor FliW [Paenibacillus naphthalenovorans]GCL73677.1 flagellar assembly protein FliW [Paenibacillus naphthalenovorans]SDJ12613.1 flagellar assembly factor FliW [Paenibacillus naphthalenovorans]